MLFIDIDYFKSYNDYRGHRAGDDCLAAVGKAIGHSLQRPADLAARYGGDEFVVLLPDTDTDGALDVAGAYWPQSVRWTFRTSLLRSDGSLRASVRRK